jgi:hypothetical protein
MADLSDSEKKVVIDTAQAFVKPLITQAVQERDKAWNRRVTLLLEVMKKLESENPDKCLTIQDTIMFINKCFEGLHDST